MGTGGGTSDSFGSLGFLPFGLGAGFEAGCPGEGVAPLGPERLPPPPILSLIVGIVGVPEGVLAFDAFDVAGIWMEGRGRVGATWA